VSDESDREVTIEESVETDASPETDDAGETTELSSKAESAETTSAETGSATERAVDAAAESFLELEEEFEFVGDGIQIRGQAVDVERIPASEIPDDFPAEIRTDDALALTLELLDVESERTVTTYFDWPAEGSGERLSKLLALRDVPLDRFADLHGETMLLEMKDDHFLPVLPKEEPRGDERAIYGILAAMLPSLLVFLGGIVGGVGGLLFTTTFIFIWLLATLVVLPVSTYLDAWHLRTTTNWDGGPLFWAFFAMIPGLNILTIGAYLVLRGNAEPLI
jgi:hypothetical protein